MFRRWAGRFGVRTGGYAPDRVLPIRQKDVYLIRHPPYRARPLTMGSCMMEHLNMSQFLGMLVVMLAVAKAGGWLAQRLGQPAVLGELIGGVLVGRSSLGW